MSNRRVLVIDDDKNIVEMIKLALSNYGFEVLTALDGEVGVDMFLTEHPDVVVLDIAMPGVDGYQVIERMRAAESEEENSTPIIMLTAHQQPVMREYAHDLGADVYLTKPVIPKTLVRAIEDVLDQ
ncbi:MAG: response regulator [Chloroflexi bacterium]|nr:response regulator [Chloroflexota bacterium]